MIKTLFFLTTLFHPEHQEFQEYQEFPAFEVIFESFLGESLIGSREWKQYLIDEDPYIEPEIVSERFSNIFKRYAKKRSQVVDYLSGYGGDTLLLSRLVGVDGQVLAFGSESNKLRGLFWNLVRAHVQNTKIYHLDEDLDAMDLEEVSMILVDAKGKEDVVLQGAKKTIKRCKPVLLINLLGGIAIENGDRYIKQEFESRIEQLRRLGYTTQLVEGTWYLALPENYLE